MFCYRVIFIFVLCVIIRQLCFVIAGYVFLFIVVIVCY